MKFLVEYDKQSQQFLKKLDKYHVQRIMDKLDELFQDTSVPHTAKAIVGEHAVFRVRVGDWRALYRVNYSEGKVIVFKIDKRENVYD